MYECDKNQVPCSNVKNFKNEIFGNFGPLWTWPTLDEFYYSYFIIENNRYSRCLNKIWNKIISFDMIKGEFKTSNRKNEEKDEFEFLKMSP
jgi:hypothetical protein